MDSEAGNTDTETDTEATPALLRALPLPLVALYGLGTTIGAGIFVLVGKIAGLAGTQAPLSFLVACAIAALSAFTFAELASRFPESAGEAAYVREGLNSRTLSLLVGLGVIVAGIVSSAAIVNGFVGYLAELLAIAPIPAIVMTVVVLAAIAGIGVAPSVGVAALVTVFEIGALLAVIAAAVWSGGGEALVPPRPVLPQGAAGWTAVMSGAVLAFYAFIGFEDIVNVAEEARDPVRTIPLAIFITLGGTLVLYVLVSVVSVAMVPLPELAASAAPLVAVFERASGVSGKPLAAVAVVSVLNGALIQTIMAARVLYGLVRREMLPEWLGTVNRQTHTPLRATLLISALILVLAVGFPIEPLARATSVVTVSIFALVNLALIGLRFRDRAQPGTGRPGGSIRVPLVVPVSGFAASVGLLGFQLLAA